MRLWPEWRCQQFFVDEVSRHRHADTMSDDDLPICTPHQRWQRGGQFAVMKKGRKKAVRLLDTQEQADIMVERGGGDFVEQRPIEYVRCERYCNVNRWCRFFKDTVLHENEGRLK